jgi:subtilisin family serine protease
MASPHVAGALALLLEQQPTIDVAQAKSLLTQSANTAPLTSGGAVTTWGAGKLEVGPGVLSVTPSSGLLAVERFRSPALTSNRASPCLWAVTR